MVKSFSCQSFRQNYFLSEFEWVFLRETASLKLLSSTFYFRNLAKNRIETVANESFSALANLEYL